MDIEFTKFHSAVALGDRDPSLVSEAKDGIITQNQNTGEYTCEKGQEQLVEDDHYVVYYGNQEESSSSEEDLYLPTPLWLVKSHRKDDGRDSISTELETGEIQKIPVDGNIRDQEGTCNAQSNTSNNSLAI